MFIERMHTTAVYSPGDETVQRLSRSALRVYRCTGVRGIGPDQLHPECDQLQQADFWAETGHPGSPGRDLPPVHQLLTQLISTTSSENTLRQPQELPHHAGGIRHRHHDPCRPERRLHRAAVNTRVEVAVPLVSRVSDSFDHQSITAIPLTLTCRRPTTSTSAPRSSRRPSPCIRKRSGS